jgi:hypothetical protein
MSCSLQRLRYTWPNDVHINLVLSWKLGNLPIRRCHVSCWNCTLSRTSTWEFLLSHLEFPSRTSTWEFLLSHLEFPSRTSTWEFLLSHLEYLVLRKYSGLQLETSMHILNLWYLHVFFILHQALEHGSLLLT